MKSSSSEAPKGGAGSKIKLYLIGLLVLVVLGAVLYFVGLQAGKAQLAAQATKFGAQRSELESSVASANAARDAARNRASMMEARGALYRAAIDLDARNFGTANEHLKESAAALGRATAPDTEALRGEISATDLNVAVDLSGQRDKVLGFAEQLNAMIPVEIETTAPTATSDAEAPSNPSAP